MTEAQRRNMEYLESIEFPSNDEQHELQALYELELDERMQYIKSHRDGVPA